MPFTPRVIRLKDAPGYCGMDIRVFNKSVRPYLRQAPIGSQGVGFDRKEIDMFLDHYFNTHGEVKGNQEWLRQNVNTERQVLNGVIADGISTSSTEDTELKSLAEQLIRKKPTNS